MNCFEKYKGDYKNLEKSCEVVMLKADDLRWHCIKTDITSWPQEYLTQTFEFVHANGMGNLHVCEGT